MLGRNHCLDHLVVLSEAHLARRYRLPVCGISAKNIETGERVKSCTIIVTAANEFTRAIHDRMPVILDPAQFEPWLGGAAGTELLKPALEDLLQMWPVSRRVNSSGAPGDDPALIEKVAA